MESDARVYIVDDEPVARQALCQLIRSVGIPTEAFASADEFLSNYDPGKPGCLILDVRLPGMSGLQLQEVLNARGLSLPTIIVTGFGTIAMAVRAVKAGAFDFIEKPFREQDLLERVQAALQYDANVWAGRSRKAQIASLMARLTRREREVLDLVIAGKSNKMIGDALGLSHKTIEYHRAKIMEKLNVESVPELVQMAVAVRGIGETFVPQPFPPPRRQVVELCGERQTV